MSSDCCCLFWVLFFHMEMISFVCFLLIVVCLFGGCLFFVSCVVRVCEFVVFGICVFFVSSDVCCLLFGFCVVGGCCGFVVFGVVFLICE